MKQSIKQILDAIDLKPQEESEPHQVVIAAENSVIVTPAVESALQDLQSLDWTSN